MKKIFTLMAVLLIVACQQKRKYKYTEVYIEEELGGGNELKMRDEKVIDAVNDSIAYSEAYLNFLSADRVAKEMVKRVGRSITTPVNFILIDDKGEDLTKKTLNFDWMKSTKELKNLVDSMDFPK